MTHISDSESSSTEEQQLSSADSDEDGVDDSSSEANNEESKTNEQELALDGSDTESDEDGEDVDDHEDDSDDDDDDEDDDDEDDDDDDDEDDDDADDSEEKHAKEATATPISTHDRIAQRVMEQYKEKKGKQLYIRFPAKLPEDETAFQQKVCSLSELIVAAHKPRQRHARFCLVDFKSQADRDAALVEIRQAIKTDKQLDGIVLNIPHTENLEFVQSLIDKKQMAQEKRKAKARLRKASKAAAVTKDKNFTTSVVIVNLPPKASVAEVRRLFPHAIDVQLKPRKNKMAGNGIATITLPTTMEARTAVKQKLSLAGTPLIVRFNTRPQQASGKSGKPNKRKNSESVGAASANTTAAKKVKKATKTVEATSAKKVQKTTKIEGAGATSTKKIKLATKTKTKKSAKA